MVPCSFNLYITCVLVCSATGGLNPNNSVLFYRTGWADDIWYGITKVSDGTTWRWADGRLPEPDEYFTHPVLYAFSGNLGEDFGKGRLAYGYKPSDDVCPSTHSALCRIKHLE